MKIGTITNTNKKGQLVIPKNLRNALNINDQVSLNLTLQGNSICITPIKEVIPPLSQENSYLNLLRKTQGSWQNNNWSLLRKQRKATEITASKQRKKSW